MKPSVVAQLSEYFDSFSQRLYNDGYESIRNALRCLLDPTPESKESFSKYVAESAHNLSINGLRGLHLLLNTFANYGGQPDTRYTMQRDLKAVAPILSANGYSSLVAFLDLVIVEITGGEDEESPKESSDSRISDIGERLAQIEDKKFVTLTYFDEMMLSMSKRIDEAFNIAKDAGALAHIAADDASAAIASAHSHPTDPTDVEEMTDDPSDATT